MWYSVISVIVDLRKKIGNRPVRGRLECIDQCLGGGQRRSKGNQNTIRMDAEDRWIPTPISCGYGDCPPGPYRRFLPEQGNPRSACLQCCGDIFRNSIPALAHPEALLLHLTDDNVELSDKALNEAAFSLGESRIQ